MNKLLIAGMAAAVAGISSASAQEMTLNGAGASFPAPLYRVWTYNYQKATGVRVNYQSVGSGAGINQIKAKTVDFGASDEPLKKEELDKSGLVQFPMAMGGVVVIVNLPGVENNQLKLDAKTLSEIFLGKITKWNDEAILKLNPGLTIPVLPITTVHRADGSGTTWVFTDYLTKVSNEWKSKVGCGKAVKWPVGLAGPKNPGVCNNVRKVSGSIGYVEYAYALEAKFPTVLLQNRDGKFVAPGIEAFQAAGANADWANAPGFFMEMNDQPGADTWPIAGATYILIYKDQQDMAKAQAMLKYFNWCYNDGAVAASKLHYVPMPKNVVDLVNQMWTKEVKVNGEPAYTK